MTESAKDKLIKRLAAAQHEQENVQMGLIQLEIDERMAGNRAGHDQAKAALEAAEAALVDPLAQLAMLEEKIVAAEEKCFGLRQRIDQLAADDDDDDAPDELAAVKMHLLEWEARVTRLRSKRDFAESGFQPLIEARTGAAEWVKVFQGAKYEVGKMMLDPFGEDAQGTDAYKTWRQPYLFPVLLLRDRESPEWDMAVQELEFLVHRLGYKLVYDAELAAQALRSEMADAAAAELPPTPNAQEVMGADMARLVNEFTPPSRIEDHRLTPPVPRNAMVPEHMQAQTLRDLGLR